MARHCRRPNDDYLDGLKSDSLDNVSLSDEDKVFNVKVDDAGYKISLTDINDKESNDISNFSNNCDDFNIKDQV